MNPGPTVGFIWDAAHPPGVKAIENGAMLTLSNVTRDPER